MSRNLDGDDGNLARSRMAGMEWFADRYLRRPVRLIGITLTFRSTVPQVGKRAKDKIDIAFHGFNLLIDHRAPYR